MPMLAHVTIAVLAISSGGWTQTQAPASGSPSPEALVLLQQAGKKYADAKSYRIEEVEEEESRTELSREWHRTLSKAMQESGNRYHYESRSSNGSRMRVSDGKTEWVYDAEDNSYTQHPASADGPATPQQLSAADLGEFNARKLRKELADLGTNYQSAEELRDETLSFGDHKLSCAVVKVSSANAKKPESTPGEWSEKTIWIEKDDYAIRKIVTHRHSPTIMTPAIFEDVDTTETFAVVELDTPLSADLFTFAPPETAKLVDRFPSPFESASNDLTSKPAPDVKLKTADGRELSLSSFRGKPVVIDFWGTWCLPCGVSLPQLTELYQHAKDKGLVFLSVDEDEEAKTAAEFLAKKQIPWQNFHDAGDIGKAFNKSGLPLTVLVDDKGKIVFYETGYSDGGHFSGLRAAIAKLGPEYASLSQTPSGH
ncbi:MAG TPA: redoxin family protein [Candidatus Sulfotelmatobacter sp.]|nr:redoxin family protein [Candidatus Sulfotelmatobacter sp.]